MIGRLLTLAAVASVAHLVDELRLDVRRLRLRVIRLEALEDQRVPFTPWWLKDPR